MKHFRRDVRHSATELVHVAIGVFLILASNRKLHQRHCRHRSKQCKATHFGRSEIRDFQVSVFTEQQVVWFKIAMHHVLQDNDSGELESQSNRILVTHVRVHVLKRNNELSHIELRHLKGARRVDHSFCRILLVFASAIAKIRQWIINAST